MSDQLWEMICSLRELYGDKYILDAVIKYCPTDDIKKFLFDFVIDHDLENDFQNIATM